MKICFRQSAGYSDLLGDRDGWRRSRRIDSLILRNLANLSKLVFVFKGNLSWVSSSNDFWFVNGIVIHT